MQYIHKKVLLVKFQSNILHFHEAIKKIHLPYKILANLLLRKSTKIVRREERGEEKLKRPCSVLEQALVSRRVSNVKWQNEPRRNKRIKTYETSFFRNERPNRFTYYSEIQWNKRTNCPFIILKLILV